MAENGGDWRQRFLRRMWASVEPVVIHAVVVVVLVLSAIIAALLVHVLAIVSPRQDRLVEFFDRLDLVAVILFLSIFCAHGAIVLLIQVRGEISDKWNHSGTGLPHHEDHQRQRRRVVVADS